MTSLDPRLPRGSGLVTALAAALAASPFLLYPPGRDQSVFLLAGRALAGGAVPYRDFWDIKPPGLFMLYMLPGSFAFSWPGAAALVDIAALFVAVLTLFRLLRQWGAPVAGLPAALALTGLWVLAGDWWDVGQGERLAVPLLLLALLAASRPQLWRWATAGACIAGMVLLKTSFLPWCLALLPFLGGQEAQPGVRRRQLLLAAGIGLLAPITLVLLGLTAGGALREAYGATIGFTGHYTRLAWQRPAAVMHTATITGMAFLRGTWPLWLLAAAAWGLRAETTTRTRQGRLAATLALIIAALAVLAQGKFFPYHWVALWPPLALLAGLGTVQLGGAVSRRLPSGRRQGMAALVSAAIAVAAVSAGAFTLAPGWSNWNSSVRRAFGTLDGDRHLSGFRVQGMGYDELRRTAGKVAAATGDDQPLLLWGFEPAFYLYAGRPFPGRFPFAYPLVTPWAPPTWRNEFLTDFHAEPAAAVVIRRGDPIPWVAGIGGDGAARLQRFPEFAALLQRDYRPRQDLSSRHLQVWLRIRPGGSAPPPPRP